MKANQLIIFDVCNTLVDTNSTFSYVDYLIWKWIKPKYKFLFHNKYIWYLHTLLYILFHFDSKIYLVKKYFKGLNVDKIESYSKEFYKWYENKIFPNMFDLIKSEKNRSKVILLSASINQPIDFLKSKFWIEWFSSVLEEKNGIYTWNVEEPLRWNKESIFEKWYLKLSNYSWITFYTDNLDDIWLIRYLNNHNKNVNICIVPYRNKKYWNNYFINNKYKYEFVD